jgi:hypothetical protein
VNFEQLLANESAWPEKLFMIAIKDIWRFREFDRWYQPKGRVSEAKTRQWCMELGRDIKENGQHSAIVITCSLVKQGGRVWQGTVVEGNHRLRGMIQVGVTHVIARLAHGRPGDKKAKAKFPCHYQFYTKSRGHKSPEGSDLFGKDKVFNVPWPEEYLE